MKTAATPATHKPLPWKFIEDDPKTLSGMKAWGKTFAIITDDADEIKQLFVGFTLEEADAAYLVKAANAHPLLVEALDKIINAGNIDNGAHFIVDIEDINRAKALLASLQS